MPQIKENDPRPPYVQIADDIRGSIAAARFVPGDRLKSVRVLAEEYGVAQMTVWQALRLLKAEGLLVTWKGRGVFVAEPGTGGADGEEPEDGALIERLDQMIEQLHRLEERVAALEADRSSGTPAR